MAILSLSETLARAQAYFVAEPAAVSLVAEVRSEATWAAGVEYAAIRRSPRGAELVGLAASEERAQALLERAASVAAGDDLPLAYSGQIIGREVRLETNAGPALVRIDGPARVGERSASYPCTVLEPRELRGSVWTAPVAQLYDALRAADRAGRS